MSLAELVRCENQSQERERMSCLAESFPSLRKRDGVEPWDQQIFARAMSGGQSNAEKQAAAFVLSVWNGSSEPQGGGWWNERPFRVGRFDAVHAMAIWDDAHQRAFLAWCENPFWP
jgi:hypothetical protein